MRIIVVMRVIRSLSDRGLGGRRYWDPSFLYMTRIVIRLSFIVTIRIISRVKHLSLS